MAQGTGGRSRRLTAEQLATWRAFIETSQRLRAVLGARLQSETGLSPGDYTVLVALNEADANRMRSSALAEHIGWQRSRLSHHLGRMERRGLIRRDECAADSRGAEITATDEGLGTFRGASVPHLRAVDELFIAALTPAQFGALGEAITALQNHLAGACDARRPLQDGDSVSATCD
ncbi:MAG TPA: MarR family transcriptional regulator [Nakamurella sp.]|jgi:DNA-binding MarR family transcriptional regulator